MTTCRHCVVHTKSDGWIDPEASGDNNIMWRETCDSHDTRAAEHEPQES